jgi:hypothetical protein
MPCAVKNVINMVQLLNRQDSDNTSIPANPPAIR